MMSSARPDAEGLLDRPLQIMLEVSRITTGKLKLPQQDNGDLFGEIAVMFLNRRSN